MSNGLYRIGGPAPRKGAGNCFTCQAKDRAEWCTLEPDDLKILNTSKVCNIYEPGQVVFYEGAPCLGIYCIESGSLALKKSDGGGGSVVVGIFGAGQTLGYTAYFSDRPHTACAEALERTQVCFVERTAIRTLLSRNPALGIKFLNKFADRLAASEEERVRALTLPLRARLAHLLLVFKDRSSTVDDEGTITIELPLSRRDIAAMVGARPESLSRVLRDLENDGVATFGRREAVIPDLDLLIDEVEGAEAMSP
jgi:CRP/FNR family transcriptional regulator